MSETLRDLVVSLSLNSDNFTRNIKSINKQIQEAESAFRLASAGVENFETTTAGLSSKLSTLQRTFQLQQDAVGQYERALQQASDKLQECYTRQNDYAQRLADAKDKQQQLKTEVASAAQAYKHYKNTLGETDSATIAAKANLDAYKGEYRAAVQEVKKLEGQNVALKKSTQNAADAFSAAQTKLNGAKVTVKETAAEIDQCNRQLALSRTSWASAGEAIQTSQRSVASIGKQMKTAESSYRLAAAGVKDFDKSAAGLTAKLTLLQEKLGLQQKAVAEYEKTLAAVKEQLQAAQQVNDPDKIREATDAVQDAETALTNARAAVKQTQADIANCNKELKTAQSEWTKAGKSLESFGKACDNVSKNLNKAGKLLSTTLTTPIVALGTAAVKSSIDFESSFTSVRKTVDATEAQFEQLEATSKKMSTEVAAGTDEINEVMASGGQLGVATEHLSDFTRVMIDLGNSCEDLNAGDAATTIAQFANIMGTSQSQFSNIGSTLVDLGNNFATTEKPMATLTLPRVATHKINYSTGEAWTQGADAAVYCSAKYKNMAQWQYDLTALQTERGVRDIIITRETVSWSTSAKYTYDIRVQNARCYGRNWGVYLGDAKGSSTYSHWISTSRAAPHDSITLIQDTINSGATAIYVSCQNASTSASGYGKCEYGTFTIEYEYATPRTVIEYLVADKTMIALGESVNVTVSVRNITAAEISAVQLQAVREVDGTDVAIGDAVTVDVTIGVAETAIINQTLVIPTLADAPRTIQLYVKVSIAGVDAEKAALCEALNQRYNPAIEVFNVYRAKKNITDDNWARNDNGIHTLTDLKIALDDGATDYHLYVYYSTGLPDTTSTSNRIDLTDMISSAKNGIENTLAIVDTVNGWSLDSEWHFAVVLTDGYESTRMDAEIGKAFTNVHFAGLATGGVRFGGYCTRSTLNNPAFECEYPIYADGGIANMDYSTTETKTAAKWIDGKRIYRRVFVAENVTDSDYSFDDAIEGLETVATVSGMFYNQYGQFRIPYMTSGGGWASVLVEPSKQVLLQKSSGIGIDKVVVIVNYTKGA